MDTLPKLCILWAGCCVVACSSTSRYLSGHHRQSEIQQHSEARITDFRAMSVEQLDSLSLVQVHQAWQELEAVAIHPVGRFSYHRDSGFSGQAEKVVIYNRRKVAYDALQNEHHSHTLQERHQQRDSTHTRETVQYRTKTTARTGTSGSGRWLIFIAVIVLIILARVLGKRFSLGKLLRVLFGNRSG
ncbi:hypothetical protein [Sinomicrobium oceani]|nr:hypothetical protein [Sinomicrobium oceani]